jgi:uncharacterized protein YbaP (TraB family)
MAILKNLRLLLTAGSALLVLAGTVDARELPAIERPLLWMIRSSPPSWLFGTIHLPDERLDTLPAVVEKAFEESTAFYAEVPLSSAMQLKTTRGMLRNDQRLLTQVLPPQTLARLQLRLRSFDPSVGVGRFIGMKTWAVMLSLVMLEHKARHPQGVPLDLRLYELAQLAGKHTGGLESVEQQLAYFDEFSELEQVGMLDNKLRQMDAAEKQQTTLSEIMMQWYLRGDISSFAEMLENYPVSADRTVQQRAEKRLINDRNKRMAMSIIEILRLHPGQSHFFAVGAAHLGGDKSVQHYLKQLGLATRRAGASTSATVE